MCLSFADPFVGFFVQFVVAIFIIVTVMTIVILCCVLIELIKYENED